MIKTIALSGLLIAATIFQVNAQTAAPAPAATSQSPAQQSNAAGIPECATIAEQQKALGGKTASGSEKIAAQPAERSGILPSAGNTGNDPSAAPTMSENGKEVRSPLDCPLIEGHPNAPMPTTLPKQSK